MKNLFKKLVLALATVCICTSVYALPSGGQWAADRVGRPEWLNESGLDKVNSVNMILCFINSFWIKDMVGQGPYKAKVDEGKCNNSTSKYRDVIAQLSYDSSGATVGNLWIFYNQGSDLQDHGEAYNTYVKVAVSESPSESNPNGNLTVTWNDVGVSGTLFSAGTMTASKDGFTMNGNWRESATSPFGYDRMYLSGTTDSASGAVSYDDVNGSTVTTYVSTMGVNSDTYCRAQTIPSAQTKCFSRSKTAAGAKRLSWRYGVYDAQGNRFDLTNPGFNIKGPDGAWGNANRWGIWSGSSVWTDGSTVTQVTGQNIGKTYTYYSFAGRLDKHASSGGYSTPVTPSSTPLALTCNWNCPTAATIAAWESGASSSPFPNSQTTRNYTYRDGILKEDGVNTPLVTTKSTKQFDGVGFSLRSGSSSYWYNTGPNPWQKFTGLKDAGNGNQFVTFSDPIPFTYGSDTLSFEGFGQSMNIPTKVYLRADGTEIDQNTPNWNETLCNNGSLCQWVPNYLIDDQAVTLNGKTYYIQWLQSELLPAVTGSTVPSTITLGDISKLPKGEPQSNIKELIGAPPALPATDPIKVIDGKLQ